MQFLYLLPEPPHSVDELLVKYGIGNRFTAGYMPRECRVALKVGELCAPAEADDEVDCTVVSQGERVGYYPEEQTWQKVVVEGPQYWVGYWTADPPQPQELMREDAVDGHRVTLGDGNEWLIPAARSFSVGTMLPQNLILGPGGKVIGTVGETYRSLFDRAGALAAQMYRVPAEGEEFTGNFEMEPEELFRLAADALAVNYKVGVAEVNALHLFNTAVMTQIMGALVDWPGFLKIVEEQVAEGEKKNGQQPQSDA